MAPAAIALGAGVAAGSCAAVAFVWWWVAPVGYLLGGLLVPCAAIAYRFGKQKHASSPHFVLKKSTEQQVVIALAVGIPAALVNIWFLATELAKR